MSEITPEQRARAQRKFDAWDKALRGRREELGRIRARRFSACTALAVLLGLGFFLAIHQDGMMPMLELVLTTAFVTAVMAVTFYGLTSLFLGAPNIPVPEYRASAGR
jgi:hypothetical protein